MPEESGGNHGVGPVRKGCLAAPAAVRHNPKRIRDTIQKCKTHRYKQRRNEHLCAKGSGFREIVNQMLMVSG